MSHGLRFLIVLAGSGLLGWFVANPLADRYGFGLAVALLALWSIGCGVLVIL